MGFRFNFGGAGGADAPVGAVPPSVPSSDHNEGSLVARKCDLQLRHKDAVSANATVESVNVSPTVSFLKVAAPDTRNTFGRDDLALNTDCEKSVYEGGLKVWECSVDLVRYLASSDVALRDRRVIELGCGAGLPGIYSMMQGAVVGFQDFNAEVLQCVTVHNISLNCNTPAVAGFWAGDWASLADVAGSKQWDLVLSAETTYRADDCERLASAISALLSPTGRAILSMKKYYFGVGGGLEAFIQAARGCGLQTNVLEEVDASVPRVVVECTALGV